MNISSIAGWMQKSPDGVREQVRKTIRLQTAVTSFSSSLHQISDMSVTRSKYLNKLYKSVIWECQCVKAGMAQRLTVLQMTVFPTNCISMRQNDCGLYLNVLVYANRSLLTDEQLCRLALTMSRGGDDYSLFLTNLPTCATPVRFYPRYTESEGCWQVELCSEPT